MFKNVGMDICIGGPMHGKQYRCSYDSFKIAEMVQSGRISEKMDTYTQDLTYTRRDIKDVNTRRCYRYWGLSVLDDRATEQSLMIIVLDELYKVKEMYDRKSNL